MQQDMFINWWTMKCSFWAALPEANQLGSSWMMQAWPQPCGQQLTVCISHFGINLLESELRIHARGKQYSSLTNSAVEKWETWWVLLGIKAILTAQGCQSARRRTELCQSNYAKERSQFHTLWWLVQNHNVTELEGVSSCPMWPKFTGKSQIGG